MLCEFVSRRYIRLYKTLSIKHHRVWYEDHAVSFRKQRQPAVGWDSASVVDKWILRWTNLPGCSCDKHLKSIWAFCLSVAV